MNALQGAIQKLAYREPLTSDDAQAAFDIVMQGQASAVQVAALLSALRATGESPEVVAGVVRALRNAMVPLSADDPDTLSTPAGREEVVSTFTFRRGGDRRCLCRGFAIAKHGESLVTSGAVAPTSQALGVPTRYP